MSAYGGINDNGAPDPASYAKFYNCNFTSYDARPSDTTVGQSNGHYIEFNNVSYTGVLPFVFAGDPTGGNGYLFKAYNSRFKSLIPATSNLRCNIYLSRSVDATIQEDIYLKNCDFDGVFENIRNYSSDLLLAVVFTYLVVDTCNFVNSALGWLVNGVLTQPVKLKGSFTKNVMTGNAVVNTYAAPLDVTTEPALQV